MTSLRLSPRLLCFQLSAGHCGSIGFVGFAVISKVPNTLHTPLMSGTNAIHGIVLLGGLIVIGLAGNSAFNKVILVIAIAFGTINIVGGFLVTDRMLEMFKRKPTAAPKDDEQ